MELEQVAGGIFDYYVLIPIKNDHLRDAVEFEFLFQKHQIVFAFLCESRGLHLTGRYRVMRNTLGHWELWVDPSIFVIFEVKRLEILVAFLARDVEDLAYPLLKNQVIVFLLYAHVFIVVVLDIIVQRCGHFP